MVLLRLQQIGRGAWAADGKTKRLLGYPPTLELWRSKLTKVLLGYYTAGLHVRAPAQTNLIFFASCLSRWMSPAVALALAECSSISHPHCSAC